MEHKRGDTIDWDITYKDSDEVAIDLTGFTILCQARLNKSSDETLFSLTIGSGITVTDAVNGQYNIKIQDTSSYSIDVYYVDIQYTNSSGDVKSTNTFELQIQRDITL